MLRGMIAPSFSRAIVSRPADSFAGGLTSAGLGARDLALARGQHDRYVRALAACGLEVVEAPSDERFPDGTFVEDTAIVTPRGAILARPGAPSRAAEVAAIRETLEACVEVLDAIAPPGSVDGGDVCAAGAIHLIGISGRTNEEGAAQLSACLGRAGFESVTVDVRGLGMLHLKSGLAWLGGRRLAAVPALADHPALAGFEIVPVEPEEAYAANCVALGGRVLIASGFPALARSLAGLGLEPVALDMSEFQKMDGGLSCLSLRF
jgi:dimethylargininase